MQGWGEIVLRTGQITFSNSLLIQKQTFLIHFNVLYMNMEDKIFKN